LPSLMETKEYFDFDAYGITDKEKEILTAVAEGKNNKEIAEQLFFSEGTVRNYISSLLDKLELRDRTQLAVFYYTKVKSGNSI
ncbi:MAG: response regulator transcription factor, partial [Eubacterium sp.]|nr:response regulator transcription factor [Eubacterium sp.]